MVSRQEKCQVPSSQEGSLRHSTEGFVLDKNKIPLFGPPTLQGEEEGFMRLWSIYGDLQRHEDHVFQNRLQVFLITTSVLLATFSQFRETSYEFIQKVIGFSGLTFSLTMLYVLWRTGITVRWFQRILRKLDGVLFPKNQQPYEIRKQALTWRCWEPPPINFILGIGLPAAVAVVWVILLCWSFLEFDNIHRISAADELPF